MTDIFMSGAKAPHGTDLMYHNVQVIDGNADKSKIIEVNNNGSANGIDAKTVQSYAGVGMALAAGLNSFFKSQKQRKKFDMDASNYYFQAQNAELNADQARHSMYSAYRSGEWQAMQRALADAQITSQIRSSNASSGVRMNEGSKREVEYSQRQSARLNQIAIQQNTTSQAMQAYRQEANLRAQATVLRGQAEASQKLAKGVNPMLDGLVSFTGTLGTMFMGIWGQMGSAMQANAAASASSVSASASSSGVY